MLKNDSIINTLDKDDEKHGLFQFKGSETSQKYLYNQVLDV